MVTLHKVRAPPALTAHCLAWHVHMLAVLGTARIGGLQLEACAQGGWGPPSGSKPGGQHGPEMPSGLLVGLRCLSLQLEMKSQPHTVSSLRRCCPRICGCPWADAPIRHPKGAAQPRRGGWLPGDLLLVPFGEFPEDGAHSRRCAPLPAAHTTLAQRERWGTWAAWPSWCPASPFSPWTRLCGASWQVPWWVQKPLKTRG